MKTVISVFFIAFSLLVAFHSAGQSARHHPNVIDSITTDKEIMALLIAHDTDYKEYIFGAATTFPYLADSTKYIDLIRSIDEQPIAKADFDANGLTDMLVLCKKSDGEQIALCVLDKGRDSLQIVNLNRWNFPPHFFPVVRKQSGRPQIISYRERYSGSSATFYPDTLVYFKDDFIEDVAPGKDLHIEKVEYSTSPCFGECPVFSIKIEADGEAMFKAMDYNERVIDERKHRYFSGDFITSVDTGNRNKLFDLLRRINFPDLKNSYRVQWTDDQTCTLKITYNGGKTKTINDYGQVGTYGLQLLYKYIWDLRYNQQWIKQ